MTTGFNTQIGGGEYRLQFETNNKEYYLLMQTTARRCVDGKPTTNADRIRAMSDAELADKIYQLNTLNAEGRDFSLLFCDGKANCIDAAGNISCNDEREKACILRWLRQIAEE